MNSSTKKPPPTIEDAFDWIEANLRVPAGPLRGQPFQLPEWQRDFARAAFAPECQEAGLSVARKNGKTGLIAALVLAHLIGPLNRPRWRAVTVSMTGLLAIELRTAVYDTARESGLAEYVRLRKSPTPGAIYGKSGAQIDILAADKATGHAIGADLAIVDEAGQLQENRRGLWEALYTSISGRNGRLVAISIQGTGPMFDEMRKRRDADSVVFHEFRPEIDLEKVDRSTLSKESTWRAGNPGLGTIKSLDYFEKAAKRALSNPASLPEFLAYDLNLPVDPDRQALLSLKDWKRTELEPIPPRGPRVVLGIDLGGSTSMTAAVAYWPDTNRAEAWAAWPAIPSLPDREENDNARNIYTRCAKTGRLKIYGDRVTDARAFLDDVLKEIAPANLLRLGADRYRKSEVEEILAKVAPRLLRQRKVVWRGNMKNATGESNADIEALIELVVTGRWKQEKCLLTRHALAETVRIVEESGMNRLGKLRSTSRIDVMQAAVIAARLGRDTLERPSHQLPVDSDAPPLPLEAA